MLLKYIHLLLNTADKLTWIFLFVGIAILISFLIDSKKKNKKVVFAGDSLTQYGAAKGGYIYLMKCMLKQQHIDNYDLIGAGVGGNKITDLQTRLLNDVIAKSPTIVVIWIGTNDVWHKYTHAAGTPAAVFENTYRDIIKQLLADDIKLLLVTPPVIGEKRNGLNYADDELDAYARIIRNIAAEFDIALCDMRELFSAYEENNNTSNAEAGILTHDGVHFNDAGNQFAAEEMWKVLQHV